MVPLSAIGIPGAAVTFEYHVVKRKEDTFSFKMSPQWITDTWILYGPKPLISGQNNLFLPECSYIGPMKA